MACTYCAKDYNEATSDSEYASAFCSTACELLWVQWILKNKPAGELMACCAEAIERANTHDRMASSYDRYVDRMIEEARALVDAEEKSRAATA